MAVCSFWSLKTLKSSRPGILEQRANESSEEEFKMFSPQAQSMHLPGACLTAGTADPTMDAVLPHHVPNCLSRYTLL